MTRAWVEVDLNALAQNGAAIRDRSGVPLLPMVGADGYGIGAVRAALALESIAPWGFGVATITEGEELRRAGIKRPIVVLTPVLRPEIDALRRADLTPALGDPAVIESWARTARPWHLQIDTGMSRAGMPWRDVGRHRDLLARSAPSGVFTQFHAAELTDASREAQRQRFDEGLAALPTRPALVHAENGPSFTAGEPSAWTLSRPGIFLFGVPTIAGSPLEPAPVASIRARIVEIRTIFDGETVGSDGSWIARGERRIATVPVGYADGYRRSLSNRGVALLRGRRIQVAGNVTMDMTMLDVTGSSPAIGDLVTLLGPDGDDCISVRELADRGELSAYELLAGLKLRLPRRYRAEDGVAS